MESEAYGQASVITDEPLRTLEFMDKNHSEEELQPITLEFSNQISELLQRISKLLRRPLSEFLQDLLTEGALSLASHIEEAFKSGGMESDSRLGTWARDSIEFGALAKSDSSPTRTIGKGKGRIEQNCWDDFMIAPPKRYASKKAAMA